MAYVAEILPVVVHEILGHGFSAILLGGSFERFRVGPDGSGTAWSRLPEGGTPGERVFHLMAGAGASTLVGLALLAAASWRGRSVLARFVLLALAFGCLLDGPPYMFWNSLLPSVRGDFHRVLEILPGLRPAFLGTGALVGIGVILWFSVAILRVVEEWFGSELPAGGRRRLAVVAVLALVPGAVWFLFDWSEFTPGLGRTPGLVGLALHVAAGAVLWLLPPRPASSGSPEVPSRPARNLAWGVAVALLLLTSLWWRHGVKLV